MTRWHAHPAEERGWFTTPRFWLNLATLLIWAVVIVAMTAVPVE